MILYCLDILFPAAVGAALVFFRSKRPGQTAALCAGGALLLTLICATWGGDALAADFGDFSLAFAADGVSRVFAVLVGALFLLCIVFAGEYAEDDARRAKLFGFMLLTLGAMLGLCFARNLFTFYLFFEAMGLASFPLVLHDRAPSGRRAAFWYLGFSVCGAALVLGGLILGGAPLLGDFRPGGVGLAADGRSLAAYFLIAVGFSCKAGMYPLSAWLPTAHPEAPAPASALMSGVITKAGILGLLRTTYFVFGADALRGSPAQRALLCLALTTVFLGSMLAYKERLMKKRLAYSSVSQLSYVIFGLLLLSPGGWDGALLQVVFHASAKVGLFLCAGAIIHKTGLLYVDELRGLGRRMPVVMCCFTLFSLSLIGIPPLGGFAAKWALCIGALDGGAIGIAGIVLLIVSALLTAGYLLPVVSVAFFPGEDYRAQPCEPGPRMTLPLGLLAGVLLLGGLFPRLFTAPCAALAAMLVSGGAL